MDIIASLVYAFVILTIYGNVFRSGRLGAILGAIVVLIIYWVVASGRPGTSSAPAIALFASVLWVTVGIGVGGALGSLISKAWITRDE